MRQIDITQAEFLEIETLRVDPLTLELVWAGPRLRAIELRWSRSGDAPRVHTEWGRELSTALERYLGGERAGWPDIPLQWDRLSPFSAQVLKALSSVSAGQWLSYSGLAARCGRPRAARAVGRIMATNPWPLIIPCHRVLGRQGKLVGFGPGLAMKRFLLNLEGVAIPEFSAKSPVHPAEASL
jgi:methylated-DNA-[protein]-cysteine S-methyltransferase